MSALESAFEALCDLIASYQSTFMTYSIGAMPAADSLVMQISTGSEENTGLDLCGDLNLDVVVNAKHKEKPPTYRGLADPLCKNQLAAYVHRKRR